MTGQHRAPSFLRRVFKVSGFRDVVSPGIPVGSSHRGVGSCPTNTSAGRLEGNQPALSVAQTNVTPSQTSPGDNWFWATDSTSVGQR